MKLLDTTSGNTKLGKTNKKADGYRVAGLSLMPANDLCPGAKKAGCMATCLSECGRGVFPNVKNARQTKADFFREDRPGFIAQLKKELSNFAKACSKQGKKPAVRLNVLSDVDWMKEGIIQAFPEILFYDYTKIAARCSAEKLPENYKLIYSHSAADNPQNKMINSIWKGSFPVAVVFAGGMPAKFKGRRVIDGDQNDLENVLSGPVVIGLKAKGKSAANLKFVEVA
jgi:hypothetical protein